MLAKMASVCGVKAIQRSDITGKLSDLGISGHLQLLHMEETPDFVFILTGSIADGSKNPNDVDFFVKDSAEVRFFLEALGFSLEECEESYDKDRMVHSVFIREKIHVQTVSERLFSEKMRLMYRFHTLMNSVEVYPEKSDRNRILETLSM